MTEQPGLLLHSERLACRVAGDATLTPEWSLSQR